MPSVTAPRYYVYILCRPSGKPFYVGKGNGARVFKHDQEARNGCDCPKCKVIRSIWKRGGSVQRYILLETGNEREAYAYEMELIAMHSRKVLTNRTDGGRGSTGHIRTEEGRRNREAMAASRAEARRIRAERRLAILKRWG